MSTTPSVRATPSPLVETRLTPLVETGKKKQLRSSIYLIYYIPDALTSTRAENESAGNKHDSSSNLEKIATQSCSDDGTSNISLVPPLLQMGVSALDVRRDVDIEVDGPTVSSNVQQKFGVLPIGYCSFYKI